MGFLISIDPKSGILKSSLEKVNFEGHAEKLFYPGEAFCRDRACPCPNFKADSHPAKGGIPTLISPQPITLLSMAFQQSLNVPLKAV
jgi:hypothetical protein